MSKPKDYTPHTPTGELPAGTLLRRADRLAKALVEGEGRIETTLCEGGAKTLDRARQRLDLSAEHTVVGFFGATGSGKSTLFNAIAGRAIARTAPTRPTTVTAQAAIWGREGSDELLDWLGIDERVYPGEEDPASAEYQAPNQTQVRAPGLWNRIRTAVGKGQNRTLSGGLILLDLPDFDSVRRTNRELVERMLGYVDVLVWVVDPQKYADAVLHQEFIEPLASHGGTMLCVLNQADRLTGSELQQVLGSLKQLLAADGVSRHLLAEPMAVSATTGAGLEGLRSVLGQVAAAKTAALQRVDTDLDALHTELIRRDGGAAEAFVSEEAADILTASCFEASGAGTVLDAAVGSYKRRAVSHTGWIVTRWVAQFRADPLKRLHLGYGDSRYRGGSRSTAESAEVNQGILDSLNEDAAENTGTLTASSLPPLSTAQRSSVANAVRTFAAETARDIEEPWNSSIRDAALLHEDELPGAFERAIAGTDYRTEHRHIWWALFNGVQWLALLSALAGVLWLTGIAAASYLQIQLPPTPTPEGSPVPLPTLLLLLGVLLGIVMAGCGRALTAAGSWSYRRTIRRHLETGIERSLNAWVVHPVEEEIDRLERYRSHLR